MRRILATTALCATIGLVAAGCGGSSDGAAAPANEGAQQQGQGQAGFTAPTGSGKVVEVSGSTAQVQGQSAQVAVTWTGKTTFSQQVSAAFSDVAVGSCVMVMSGTSGSSSSSGSVAATSVRITEATDGECTMAGRGGGQGGQGAGPEGGTNAPQGERPSGAPSGAPTDRRGFGGASGKVTAVTSAGFTVASTQGGASSGKTTSVAVTTSDDTAYTTTAKASASDVKTGVCVTSRGDADDTGAVTADSIAISKAVDGACAMGFGARPQS